MFRTLWSARCTRMTCTTKKLGQEIGYKKLLPHTWTMTFPRAQQSLEICASNEELMTCSFLSAQTYAQKSKKVNHAVTPPNAKQCICCLAPNAQRTFLSLQTYPQEFVPIDSAIPIQIKFVNHGRQFFLSKTLSQLSSDSSQIL